MVHSEKEVAAKIIKTIASEVTITYELIQFKLVRDSAQPPIQIDFKIALIYK